MKLLMFAASLRKDSCNKKLIKIAADIVQAQSVTAELVDFAEFDMPLYDANLQQAKGLPEGTLKFIARLKDSDGLIISSPEYNFSTPGTLKNLIDWVSRDNPQPWKGKQILLMSASPSLVGGNRGLWATRVPLETCGAFVYPDMFSLANAYQAFDETGKLKDNALLERLQANIKGFLQVVAMYSNSKN